MKNLIPVHSATQNPEDEYDDWFRCVIGDLKTGLHGRLLYALWTANRLAGEVRLFLPVSPSELKGERFNGRPESVQKLWTWLKDEASDEDLVRVRLDRTQALDLLFGAHYDWWEDAAEKKHPINTNGEALRARIFAEEEGFDWIMPISTGYGHAARCGDTDFATCEPCGIDVAGYAPAPFARLGKQRPAIIDPVHLTSAPFAGVDERHQFHLLIPAMFVEFKGDGPRYDAFNEALVDLMKKHGITKNVRGEAL
ncbi:MAG: hypothetical protein COY40_06210 [Alphaproteobacteria bacterium CG_4_10_14_0_8_um_filter_53_9]|nr:MAG: hypothetical protein COY40_06210 [Alphaproteobacteria bacterium CG_4_10_14_0_8_um_filter_53_9]